MYMYKNDGYVRRNEKQDLRRVTTWENHHLIKAESPEKAFDKAVKLEMESIFVGIGELLPIYEGIEDGAELMWNDYGFISNRRTMRMPYEKKEHMELIKPKQQPKK